MKKSIIIILTVVIFVYTWMYQDNRFTSRIFHERLKNSINRAAHDASLQVDKTKILEGKIVFDETQALTVFKNTLSANLGLDTLLKPKPGTLLKDQVSIVIADYIDENDGVSYPYLYTNTQYKINRTIYGPSVIYVIRVKYPIFYTLFNSTEMFKSVIFEYPFPI